MAGSKSNTLENSLLKLIFQNIDLTGIGDAGGLLGSVADGNLYVALATDDSVANDADAGTECTYTGYTRVAVTRDTDGWDVADNVASNHAAVTFGECTGGDETARYVEIYTASPGGTRLFWAQLDDDLVITSAPAVTPYFAAGDLDFTED